MAQRGEALKTSLKNSTHLPSVSSHKLLHPHSGSGGKKRRGSMPACPGELTAREEEWEEDIPQSARRSPSDILSSSFSVSSGSGLSSLSPVSTQDGSTSPTQGKRKMNLKRGLLKLASPLTGAKSGTSSDIEPIMLNGEGLPSSPLFHHGSGLSPSSSCTSFASQSEALRSPRSVPDAPSQNLFSSGKREYPSSPSSSSSASLFPFRTSSIFLPSVLAEKSGSGPSIPSVDSLRAFSYAPDQVQEILAYLMSIFSTKSSRDEIDNFLAAFANFNIDKEELFRVIRMRLNDMPSESEDPKVGSAGEALRYILTQWFTQSGAVYEKQFPKFFRTVATVVGSSKDPRINPLKLMILRNSSNSLGDAAHPFYRSIIEQTNQRRDMPAHDVLFAPKLFQKYGVSEIAVAVSCIMVRLYANIGPSELHDGSWQGKDRPVRAPHLHLLSVLFNHISFLCVVEILFAKNEDSRVSSLSKVIELGHTLKKNGNFEGMAAVGSVFGNSAIQRLKKTWSHLDSKLAKRAKKIEDLMQPMKNYKLYKEALKNTPPLLPWLAPKLRELRFMYDGNTKVESDGKIDYFFLQQAGFSINEYLQFQHNKLSLNPSPEILAILENITLLDEDIVEDCLYEQSIKVYAKK